MILSITDKEVGSLTLNCDRDCIRSSSSCVAEDACSRDEDDVSLKETWRKNQSGLSWYISLHSTKDILSIGVVIILCSILAMQLAEL